jgi:hypothetical protein
MIIGGRTQAIVGWLEASRLRRELLEDDWRLSDDGELPSEDD